MSTLDGLTEIQSASTSLVWRLQIGGLDVVYYSSVDAPPAPDAVDFGGDAVASMSYTLSRGLNPPTAQTVELDPLTGLTRKQSPLTVTISSEGLRDILYENDPVRVLGRVGLNGADWSADLVESLAHDDANVTIKVSADPSGLTFPRLVHIGQEAIWVTGNGGTGTVADPYTLTGGVRGVLGSPIQAHTVSVSSGDVPVVLSHKVAWDGSPVSLQCANRRTSDGSLGGFVEVVAGFMDGDPEVGIGAEVSLSISPLSNLLYTKLGSGLTPAYLVEGYHLFSDRASTLWSRQEIPDGMVTGTVAHNHVFGVGYVDSEESSYLDHQSAFHPDFAGRAADDPRRGALRLVGIYDQFSYFPTGYDEPGGNHYHIEIESPDSEGLDLPRSQQDQNQLWKTVETYLDRKVSLLGSGDTYTLRRWPGALTQFWNANDGMVPGSTQGADGLWYDVRLNLASGVIETTVNSEAIAGGSIYYNKRHYESVFGNDGTHLWEPLLRDNLDTNFENAPIQGEARTQFGPVASSYYHGGETHMLVQNDAPLTTPFDVLVEHTTRDGEERSQVFTIADSTEVLDGATSVGYRWDLTGTIPARGFGNYGRRPTIYPVVRIVGDDIIDVLLRLLMSGTGQGVNSATYDVYPLGLNLKSSQVDIASFTSFPRGVATYRKVIKVGESLKDLLEGILHLLGASLVQKIDTSTGLQRLALTSAGQPNAILSVGDILQIDVHNTPTTDTAHEKYNRYTYSVTLPDYDEPASVIIDYQSARAVRRSGVVDREIDLTGLDLATNDVGEIEQTLRLAASRSINYAAFSRRRFQVSVSIAKGHTLNVGDVVLLTHPTLIPANPGNGRGLSGAPCRIIKIRREYSGRSPLAAITLEYTGANTTGYAPALKVASIVDASTVTVEANAFTSSTHPILNAAQSDLGLGADNLYFEVGDDVRIYTPGDWTNGVTTSVATLNYSTRTLSFDDNHGASVGDIVSPGVYSTATARMGGYAFLAPITGASAKAYS